MRSCIFILGIMSIRLIASFLNLYSQGLGRKFNWMVVIVFITFIIMDLWEIKIKEKVDS